MIRAALCAFLFAFPAIASAATAGHGEHHGIPWATLAFAAINFSLFVFILFRFLGPTIRSWVADRRERIVQELEVAAAARREAEKLQSQWQERLANLEGEIAEIRETARADAAREREQILAAAERTARSIESDTERVMQQEVRRAQQTLRNEVAGEAVRIAERLLQDQLTPVHQDRFVTEFVEQVKP